MGSKGDRLAYYNDRVKYYMSQGMTTGEATKKAKADQGAWIAAGEKPWKVSSGDEGGPDIYGAAGMEFMKEALKAAKLPPEASRARTWLENLVKQGTPSIPTRQVAGLSEQEQQTLGILSKLLSGEYDPRTSPYFQGMREQMKIQEGEDIADIRRGAQLGGALYGTPRTRAEADYRAKSSAASNTILGGLYDQYYNPYAMMQAGTSVGALPRQVSQERMDADYSQKLSRVMFPYTTLAQIQGAQANLPFTPVDQTQWTALIRPEQQKKGFFDYATDIAKIIGSFTGKG